MIETGEGDISFWDGTFWNLWWMKIFRNFASVKYQWMFLLYVPTLYGMFTFKPGTTEPWISATLGLGFLGGGFITLALGRLMANTRLKEGADAHNVNVHTQSIKRGQPDPTVVMGDQVRVDPYFDAKNILDTDK